MATIYWLMVKMMVVSIQKSQKKNILMKFNMSSNINSFEWQKR
jgi:hypothetical protein